LTLVAFSAVTAAASSATTDSTPSTQVSGFDGPVATAPRALDRDDSNARGTLHRVRCASALPGASCWVAR
jgi:hypothetical protein